MANTIITMSGSPGRPDEQMLELAPDYDAAEAVDTVSSGRQTGGPATPDKQTDKIPRSRYAARVLGGGDVLGG